MHQGNTLSIVHITQLTLYSKDRMDEAALVSSGSSSLEHTSVSVPSTCPGGTAMVQKHQKWSQEECEINWYVCCEEATRASRESHSTCRRHRQCDLWVDQRAVLHSAHNTALE